MHTHWHKTSPKLSIINKPSPSHPPAPLSFFPHLDHCHHTLVPKTSPISLLLPLLPISKPICYFGKGKTRSKPAQTRALPFFLNLNLNLILTGLLGMRHVPSPTDIIATGPNISSLSAPQSLSEANPHTPLIFRYTPFFYSANLSTSKRIAVISSNHRHCLSTALYVLRFIYLAFEVLKIT